MEITTNETRVCDNCGGVYPLYRMLEVDDQLLCPNCVTCCDNCGESFHIDSEMFEVVKDGIEMCVCYGCYMGNDWDDEDEETEDED